MKALAARIPRLRFGFYSPLWVFIWLHCQHVVANSTTPSINTTQPTTAPPTTLLTTLPTVGNISNVDVVAQNESSITLSWAKVIHAEKYFLQYVLNGSLEEIRIDAPEGQNVTHVVASLAPATEYSFTLIASSGAVNSSGFIVNASTAPTDVQWFQSVAQSASSITLEWRPVDGVSGYRLLFDGGERNFSAQDRNSTDVTGLTNASIYNFQLFTVYNTIRSRGVALTAATAPADVGGVTVRAQSETSITLQWGGVHNVSRYTLLYNATVRSVLSNNQSLTLEVAPLSAGTTYNFTLFSEFWNISSTGAAFNASTVPSQAADVDVTQRTTDTLTVTWWNRKKDWKYRLLIDGRTLEKETKAIGSASILVPDLKPGTRYNFSLTTVFAGLSSPSYQGSSLTTIDCASVDWHVTTSSIQGHVEGLFSKATATNGSHLHLGSRGRDVSFTGLYPGVNYSLALVYETDATQLTQCQLTLQTYPPLVEASCKYSDAGYSITVLWDQPVGRWDAADVSVSGRSETFLKKDPAQYSVGGLQPAKRYRVSVTTVSGRLRTISSEFNCNTDPRGVIAGSVVAVIIFAAIVCLIAFVVLKKRPLRKGRSKDRVKNVWVSAANFPDHYSRLCMDDNRGFSEHYEDLYGVGAEQSQNVATYPENQAKNRFTNILPYDRTRVKLSGKSDYINASYMPGYHHDQEYIATQGPLPSTVNDFWRMVWEQKVRSIVMVTNCVELTRTKCEQYWPSPDRCRLYGELMVSVDSETEETNWTLKDITVTHQPTSEQRAVKHFHFTAWPDHGVPQTTDVLIQFRRLVRQHIEEERSRAPTVVHCSAGVGRTGTLIALDVLLQQLQQENAVDIHGFVHKMRLRRPHMVQTEAQYVYLHQCILDSLQTHERQENVYENSDMIYVNATALREFH